jgi:hypothetical protein
LQLETANCWWQTQAAGIDFECHYNEARFY